MKKLSQFLSAFVVSCLSFLSPTGVRAEGSTDAVTPQRPSPAASLTPYVAGSSLSGPEGTSAPAKATLSTKETFNDLAKKIRSKDTRNKELHPCQLASLSKRILEALEDEMPLLREKGMVLTEDELDQFSHALFPIFADQTANYEEYQSLLMVCYLTSSPLRPRIVPLIELTQKHMKRVRDRLEGERLLKLTRVLIEGLFIPDQPGLPNPLTQKSTATAFTQVYLAFPDGRTGPLGFFIQEFFRHYGQVLHAKKASGKDIKIAHSEAYEEAIAGMERFKMFLKDAPQAKDGKFLEFTNLYKADFYRVVVNLSPSIDNDRLQVMGGILARNPGILDILEPARTLKDRAAFNAMLSEMLSALGHDPQPERWLRLAPVSGPQSPA